MYDRHERGKKEGEKLVKKEKMRGGTKRVKRMRTGRKQCVRRGNEPYSEREEMHKRKKGKACWVLGDMVNVERKRQEGKRVKARNRREWRKGRRAGRG